MNRRTAAKPARFEVHEHSFTCGSRARFAARIVHSHAGGEVPHQHPDTGPATFTIDKDEWFARTGLRGGGRKKFSVRATGEQLPIRELEDWQKSFEVVHDEESCRRFFHAQGHVSTGGGVPTAARVMLAFKAKPRFRVIRGGAA